MKAKTWTRIALAAAILMGALGLCLLLVKATLKYGLILLGLLALSVLVWKAYIKNGRDALKQSEQQNAALQDEVSDLKERLAELSRSRINVTGISPILHLSVLEIDTSFTRSYIREDKVHKLSFNGALRTDIRAEYGVRLEEVRFRYDEPTDTLYLAHFHPGMLSYSKKQMTWDIARSFRARDLFGWIELSPVDDEEAQNYTKRMKEEIRAEVEKEIDDRKIEEFAWLAPMVTRQVTDVIKLALNRPEAQVVILPDDSSEQLEAGQNLPVDEQGFTDFGTLYEQIGE